MKRVTFVTLGIVLLVTGQGAIAEDKPNLNRLLRGRYAVTQVASCVQNVPGFGEPNFDLLGGAATFTFATRAILNYKGDGTGSLEGESLSINLNNVRVGSDLLATGATPVSHSRVECRLTYEVNPDRSFTQTSTCASFFLPGNLAGVTQTVSPIQTQGQIGPGRRTLLISDTNPDVETVVRHLLDGTTLTLRRVCLRSATAIKLWESGDRDDD